MRGSRSCCTYLEVLSQIAGQAANASMVDDATSDFEKKQLIECLLKEQGISKHCENVTHATSASSSSYKS